MSAEAPRRRRRPGRWLAPLALLAAMAAIALILRSELPGHTVKRAVRRPVVTARRVPHYWTVRAGNSLEEISVRTGLSVAAIKRDNPRRNLAVIVPGERLDLWSRSGKRTTAQ